MKNLSYIQSYKLFQWKRDYKKLLIIFSVSFCLMTFFLKYINYIKHNELISILSNSSKNFILTRDYTTTSLITNQYKNRVITSIHLLDSNQKIIFQNNYDKSFFEESVLRGISSNDQSPYSHYIRIYYSYSNDIVFAIIISAVLSLLVLLFFNYLFIVENTKTIIFTKFSLAQQVSHDIRSPLAALNEIGKVENGLSIEHKALMNNAIARINDIADGLLNKKNTPSNELTVESLEISPIIDAIIKEKSIIIGHNSNIQINFTKNVHDNVKAKINKIEFERVISNILNNSIEATKKNQILTIDISLSENKDSLTIIMKDNGSGIPKHILELLGENQVSHGKENSKSGNGLGLYHAFSVIKQMNGHITIQSEMNIGTTISITLPKNEIIKPTQIILIDDDELVRTTWEWKAKKSEISLITFKSSNEFISYHQTHNLPFNTPIFVDIDLGEENGIIICEDLFKRGFTNLNLATGHSVSDINKPDYIKTIQDKSFPIV